MNNRKGFTLVELLATIVILGILISIGVIVAINIINRSKEKSYQVTINSIEKNAGNYLTENNNRLSFVPNDTNEYEYQCITVQNLMDYGYLDNNVTNSKVSENENVSSGDYIYIERDINNKTITKEIYTKLTPEYIDKCAEVVAGNGIITFKVNPDIGTWSQYKDITIIYNMNNLNDLRTMSEYEFKHEYSNSFIEYDPLSDTLKKNVKTKIMKVTRNGTIKADIFHTGNSEAIASRQKGISNIDNVGPVITKGNYTGSNTVRHSVTIPLVVTDTCDGVNVGSGVNYNSFTKEDVEVKVGAQIITDYNLNHSGGSNYNLVINSDTYDGAITLTIGEDKVLDNIENGNEEIIINTGITFDNTYRITYHGNGGTSTTLGDTWEDTVKYGEEYSTPENWYTKTGYNFNGWNEKADGTGTVWGLNSNGVYEAIRDNGKSRWAWTYLNDIDLYAQWNAKTIKVTFNCNGGTGGGNRTYTYDVSGQTFPNPPLCSKSGYNLLGWNLRSTDTTKRYNPSSGVSNDWINNNSPSITIYAIWESAALYYCSRSWAVPAGSYYEYYFYACCGATGPGGGYWGGKTWFADGYVYCHYVNLTESEKNEMLRTGAEYGLTCGRQTGRETENCANWQ